MTLCKANSMLIPFHCCSVFPLESTPAHAHVYRCLVSLNCRSCSGGYRATMGSAEGSPGIRDAVVDDEMRRRAPSLHHGIWAANTELRSGGPARLCAGGCRDCSHVPLAVRLLVSARCNNLTGVRVSIHECIHVCIRVFAAWDLRAWSLLL
jgi:hypothetical protein